ncbi:hypothetical protein Nhal_3988 (plasmid) [Nitrosococcus halophilus Nc 4]|uniref:Uncharacterized protein n=1 Tax=Nitrosococcus halophilus (strain Nc4) TaxID=472759 RepID=D5C5E3_NITHN|nr:hypothetical protein [Nitrosococcus halophilus]ADE16997.1 hypothetical protein Nhal_3988 [Nitrosococcus halophilus Nc 4]
MSQKAEAEQQETPTEAVVETIQEVRPLVPMQPVVAASPLDLPAEIFRAGLDRRKTNREALMEWIRAALVEGVDYGRIHSVGKNKCQYAAQGKAEECPNPKHWSKPSLFKPGAEKICGMLGVTVHFPTLSDYEQAAISGAGIKQVILRCELKNTSGLVMADGVGARNASKDGDDLNKTLKMAEKSAMIDAVLRMAGLSEVFTQDLEDGTHGGTVGDSHKNSEKNRSQDQGLQSEKEKKKAQRQRITPAQHRRLEARITELGLERDRVKAWLKRASKGRIEHFADMTQDIYNIIDDKLNEWAEQMAKEEASAEREAIQMESTTA